MIRQAELASFREWSKLKDEAEAELKKFKDGFMARENEEIEPGLLTMKVVTRTTRNFAYLPLVDVLGKEKTDYLKGLMPDSVSRFVQVVLA